MGGSASQFRSMAEPVAAHIWPDYLELLLVLLLSRTLFVQGQRLVRVLVDAVGDVLTVLYE